LRTKISLPIVVLLFLLLSQTTYAQYYYKDIVTTRQTSQLYNLLKAAKVRYIKLSSFEANDMPSEDFFGEQRVIGNYSQIRSVLQTEIGGRSSLSAFYNGLAQLNKTVDSSNETITTTLYTYDSASRVLEISNSSNGIGVNRKETESHQWKYNEKGQPVQMLRIRNGNDTTLVKITCDENGNVIEEQDFKKGIAGEKIYYYYDARQRLTDIVSYNTLSRRLLPDYIFQYNDQDQLIKTISVQQGMSGYLTWIYLYNEQGLKTKEVCFNKQSVKMGKVEYEYVLGR
jgi:hypothetical protein